MPGFPRRLVFSVVLAVSARFASAAPSTERITLDLPNGALPIPAGPVEPTWDSLRAHYQPPNWLVDGKFGIFIHWGLYSVPAHGSEWYARHMYSNPSVTKWHTEHFGSPDTFGYKDFIPLFRAENYDAVAWTELFRRAGARYVIPVAEHHDGFALYDSQLTRWDAKDMGPHRDLVGELAAATRSAGLVFGLSQHRMEHWSFMYPQIGLATDLFDPSNADFYGPPQPPSESTEGGLEVFEGRAAPPSAAFQEEWLRRNQELIDRYQPQLLYFDNGVNARALDPIKLRLAAYFYNRAAERGSEATLATKRDAYLAGSMQDLERGRPAGLSKTFWECDTSIGHNSWGYIEGFVCRNASEMIRELVDCVAKNGAYLLNIAPRADGSIPEDQQLRLLQIGEWLGLNGEAIYGSRPWFTFGEGPTPESVNARNPERGITNAMLSVYTAQDMRFTTQRHADGSYDLFAVLLAWPADGQVTITSLATDAAVEGAISAVEMLGTTQRIRFSRETDGLHVTLPPWHPSDHANVLKISGLRESAPQS